MRDVHVIQGAGLVAQIDAETGVIRSLKEKNGVFGTDYAANPGNVSYESFLKNPLWLGDLLIRSWTGTGWTRETTADSGDIREVRHDAAEQTVAVSYRGGSNRPGGLTSVDTEVSYSFGDDSLNWEITLANRTGALLEIGELSVPFTTNTDFSGLFAGAPHEPGPDWRETRQKEWHENRVMQHLHISGHSSYALLQRPRGDFPCLFFQPLGDAAFEAAYQIDPTIGSQWSLTFEGPYYLSLFSTAARREEKWLHNRERQSYWFHGHSSLLLQPGESKTFRFRFALLGDYAEMAEQLYRSEQVAVNVHPGMVAPTGETVLLELRSKSRPSLTAEANHIEIEELGGQNDRYRYKLHFRTNGQKKIRVAYADGAKWTNLLFYAIPPAETLLKARAAFIAERHFYDNPDDPYGRHHALLPYDDKLESLFLEGEESWQVGGADEYGLPIAMYLAEKNVYYPNEREIEVLETYIDDFLFRVLQNPDTYEIKRGCFHEESYPSRYPHQWDREASEHTWRTFNYPLVSNIYHAMYKIGKLHGLTRRRGFGEYMAMAAKTAMLGYDYGEWNRMGAPAGYNAVHLLQDLQTEDEEAYGRLNAKMRQFAEANNLDPYPFGSELYTDQTAHHQVYAFMNHYGFESQKHKTLQVTKALRAGAQPAWFRYGNEQRGNVCCWYATALNSVMMYAGYEETGDAEMLKWGFAGITGFLTVLRPNGVAHGWFTWWPDRTGFDLRSLDTDMGLYGYIKGAKSYVVRDETFGRVSFGCRISENTGGALEIVPWDGVRKRMYVQEAGIDIAVEKGELEQVVYSAGESRLTIRLADSTGLVSNGSLTVKRLEGADGKFLRIRVNGKEAVAREDTGGWKVADIPLGKPAVIDLDV